MKLRSRLLFPLVALLGAGVVVLPALAASSEAKIEVAENCNNYPKWQCWTVPGANPRPASVTVAAGAVVTFADKTSFPASITWKGAAPTCSGVPVSPAPAATGWEGTCKFEAPGTYRFEDPGMYYPEATVEVSAPATITPTGASTNGSTPSGSSGSSYPSSGSGSGSPSQAGGPSGADAPLGSLLAGAQSSAVVLGATQHGGSVHGSVDVSQAGAGGRLEVELLARSASLASAGHSSRVQVGRAVRTSLPAGTVTFRVAIDAGARRALRVHRRLALSVKITLTAPHRSPVVLTRSVVLRG